MIKIKSIYEPHAANDGYRDELHYQAIALKSILL
jgi:hypothetical protein